MFFKIKNMIMIRMKNFCMIKSCCKLNYCQLRSFSIINAWEKQVYKLKLSFQFRNIYLIFHISLLKLYWEHEETLLSPESILINSSDKWEIEDILTHYMLRYKIQYLVQWKRYISADNFWKSEECLTDISQMLNVYKKRHSIK